MPEKDSTNTRKTRENIVEFNGAKHDFMLTPEEEIPRGILVTVTRGPFETTGVLRLVRPKQKSDSIDLGGYKVELDNPIKITATVGGVKFSGVKEIEVESEVGEDIFSEFDRDGLLDAREEFWKAKAERTMSEYIEDEEFIKTIERKVEWANERYDWEDD